MTPKLERLEARDCPSSTSTLLGDWSVIPIHAENWYGGGDFYSIGRDLSLSLVMGHFFGPQYGLQFPPPHTALEILLTPAEWSTLEEGAYPPITTSRYMYPLVGASEIPLVFVPDTLGPKAAGGITWELFCFSHGWWYDDPADPHGLAAIGPGPQAGLEPRQPNWLFAIQDMLGGDPLWWG